MQRTHLIAKTLCGALAGGLLLAAPGAAWATTGNGGALKSTGSTSSTTTSDPTTTTTVPSGTGAPSAPVCSRFATAQQTVEGDLAARVTQLQTTLPGDVAAAKHLNSGDQSALNADLSSDLSGIQSLLTQAQQATTCAELRVIAKSMVADYRVYLVMTPQVHLTIAADAATWMAGYLAILEATLQQAITTASQAGINVTGAQAAFADLQTQVTNAQSAVNGVSTQVLALTPAGYPGTTTVFVAARNSLTTSRTDLTDANKDFHTIMTDIS